MIVGSDDGNSGLPSGQRDGERDAIGAPRRPEVGQAGSGLEIQLQLGLGPDDALAIQSVLDDNVKTAAREAGFRFHRAGDETAEGDRSTFNAPSGRRERPARLLDQHRALAVVARRPDSIGRVARDRLDGVERRAGRSTPRSGAASKSQPALSRSRSGSVTVV